MGVGGGAPPVIGVLLSEGMRVGSPSQVKGSLPWVWEWLLCGDGCFVVVLLRWKGREESLVYFQPEVNPLGYGSLGL